MSITCSTCGYDNNADDAEFCEACGAELQTAAPSVPQPTPIQAPEFVPTVPPVSNSPSPPVPEMPTAPAPTPPPTIQEMAPPPPPAPPTPVTTTPVAPPPTPVPPPTPITASATSARLVAKQTNAAQSEFPLNGVAVVGIFDPDSGPVDIDLENFAGGETVSRGHGEIYPEAGGWMVKDLGSTNGIFIKQNGQSRFGARITVPTRLNPGDEIGFGKVQFIFQSP